VWAIYGGLITSVGLVIFSPVVSGKGLDPVTGKNLSLLPTSIDISWFPLENPGIVSIPIGFLLGYLGTVTSKEPESEKRYTELEVRSLTGAGSEVAVHH
jgi:cation/acetate symporter